MKNRYVLISLFFYLIIHNVVALAVTPYLNEIKPNKVIGCVYPREFSLSGVGFENNIRVEIIASGVNKILEKEKVTFINSNSVKIKINTMTDPDNWYIRVSNGNAPFSNTANFSVNKLLAFPVSGELGSIIGQFKGVDAKSNGACTGKLIGLCGTNYLCEAPHQCVQYAKEYYKKHYPHISEIDSQWYTAKTFWERSKHLKLTKTIYSQNGLKKDGLPKTGDMIFFDTGHAAGHVAIVTNVDDNEINIIQQNIDRYNAFDSLKIVNDKNTGLVLIDKLRGKYPVFGWLTPNIQTQLEACTQLKALFPISNQTPGCPYTYTSSYLGECANLPMAGQVKKAINLYAKPNSGSLAGIISVGTSISAVARKRILAPCPLQVKTTQNYYAQNPYRKNTFKTGDVIFLISQIGEGSSMYWFNGELVQSNDSICIPTPFRNLNCWADPLMHCPRNNYNGLINSEEWLNVQLKYGIGGWIRVSTLSPGSIVWEERC